MELDEAIKHAEEKAEELESTCALCRRLADEKGISTPSDYEPCKKCAEEHRQLAEWLKELKQLRNQTSWISVSERLPKKDGRYYVTRHNYVTQSDFIDILWYEKGLWWNRQSIEDYAVIAWMPKPEPYKEAEE